MMDVILGEWKIVWNGGRLADIYHTSSNSPVDVLQVVPYDFERGEILEGTTPNALREQLAQWISDYGQTFEEALATR